MEGKFHFLFPPPHQLAFVLALKRQHEGIVRALLFVLVVIVQRVDEINPLSHGIKEIVGKGGLFIPEEIIADFRDHIGRGVRRPVQAVRARLFRFFAITLPEHGGSAQPERL